MNNSIRVVFVVTMIVLAQTNRVSGQHPTPVDAFFNSEPLRIKQAHLDQLATDLKRRPLETAYIFVYPATASGSDAARKLSRWIAKYMIQRKKLSSRRFVIKTGDKLVGLTEIYLIPKGAKPPDP